MAKKMQAHRRCSICGRVVKPGTGNRKCDGWFWHFTCWRRFWSE